jgi:hypothetical protein
MLTSITGSRNSCCPVVVSGAPIGRDARFWSHVSAGAVALPVRECVGDREISESLFERQSCEARRTAQYVSYETS